MFELLTKGRNTADVAKIFDVYLSFVNPYFNFSADVMLGK